ncbi:hypothetical protein MA16_Dca007716 [Dendrobium catenatum]|uniref:Uncharacterized protein n=1 Tax=Dendrobium catenatum TaxID=906689 RepID=A0A2I0X562_9ASPA|nr:hypothetical protein MA16_Dca007716 [Dendrobium catenatum]
MESPSRYRRQPHCGYTAFECATGACVLCFCCPFSIFYSCVMIPLHVAGRVARRLRASPYSCFGSRRPVLYDFPSSSSFSDIDLEAELECRRPADCARRKSSFWLWKCSRFSADSS